MTESSSYHFFSRKGAKIRKSIVNLNDTKINENAMISMNVPLISKQKNTIVMRVFHVEILLVHLNVINVYLDGEVIMITVSLKMPNSNALQQDSLSS